MDHFIRAKGKSHLAKKEETKKSISLPMRVCVCVSATVFLSFSFSQINHSTGINKSLPSIKLQQYLWFISFCQRNSNCSQEFNQCGIRTRNLFSIRCDSSTFLLCMKSMQMSHRHREYVDFGVDTPTSFCFGNEFIYFESVNYY